LRLFTAPISNRVLWSWISSLMKMMLNHSRHYPESMIWITTESYFQICSVLNSFNYLFSLPLFRLFQHRGTLCASKTVWLQLKSCMMFLFLHARCTRLPGVGSATTWTLDPLFVSSLFDDVVEAGALWDMIIGILSGNCKRSHDGATFVRGLVLQWKVVFVSRLKMYMLCRFGCFIRFAVM
jgi:hypothetical protein